MKCPKCGFTTFDGYEFCPKCNNDFSDAHKKLSIIPYTINENNNYLLEKKDIPEPTIDEEQAVEEIPENTQDVVEKTEEENIDNLLETTTIDDKSENDVKLEDVNLSDNDESISLDDINLNEEAEDENAIKLENLDMELEHNKADDFSDTDEESISLDDIDLDNLLETNRED
jgi:hypothetical protein